MSSPPQGFLKFLKIIQKILNQAVLLPFQDTINFTGAGVTAVDNPGEGRTDVTIPGATGGVFILGHATDGALGGGDEFGAFFSDGQDGTESEGTGFLGFAFTVKRVTVHIGTNTSDGILNIVMRDDGVDVPNTTVNIPAATTGSFDSGIITEAIAALSLINIKFTRNGSATEGDLSVYVECLK